ncbi:J domain-containing protein [Halalkalicoccus jeotgali]|uniref:Heat shock protein DnaJ domain protein n=1 Tax=Halalkalicoccus jeotgali (strain DSM 18796 / CECT 7217 / JCM 14584 / KCTC 4019 / B3) TaxID=795797 RepID=D8J683_HALJB|nr:J domain-containing protein [Halalkalicoccus jeotgali]ADJ15801.1 heat shock protein DnaJ domain protein [Halalkalicoccus jeotgali B3]ELY37175.1 heat shock protein DnaJ domain-containing protein [Halalkalicoccus jeotgali B3]
MQSEFVWFLPWWLVVGVLVGLAIGLVIAGVFAVGARLFPDRRREPIASGEHRKHAEIRRYLRAIDEPFVENGEIAGEVIEFYLPERDVAITFDARAFFRIEATDTHGVLVEHEMPGIHLGRRLPFETPALTAGVGTDEAAMAAFATLGLPTDANEAQIKAAYREKVKRVHPDQGGDRESFERVRTAYATARSHVADEEESAEALAT